MDRMDFKKSGICTELEFIRTKLPASPQRTDLGLQHIQACPCCWTALQDEEARAKTRSGPPADLITRWTRHIHGIQTLARSLKTMFSDFTDLAWAIGNLILALITIAALCSTTVKGTPLKHHQPHCQEQPREAQAYRSDRKATPYINRRAPRMRSNHSPAKRTGVPGLRKTARPDNKSGQENDQGLTLDQTSQRACEDRREDSG